jgi:acyl carrier protein
MSLEHDLKSMIITELKIEDLTPEEVQDSDPLFGEGIGLDSLDAVELVLLVQKHYKIEIKDMDEARKAFASVQALADYIRARQAVA